MKKFFALMLIMILTFSMLPSALADEIVFPLEEPITFTGFTPIKATGGYTVSESIAWQYALERANIKVDMIEVPANERVEKANVLLGSGEYPDFFFKQILDTVTVESYGQEGVIIPLEDLIREYAPNLTALMDERDAWDYITAGDGHIYGLPFVVGRQNPNTLFWINQRWMNNLGIEKVPENWDELYEVLKAFKEQDANGNGDPNDEIPFSGVAGDPIRLMSWMDYPYVTGIKCALIDGELTYSPTHEQFKELLAFLRKCYAEDLIDKQMFTQDTTQFRAQGQSGDIYGFFYSGGAFQGVGRDNDEDYVGLCTFVDGTMQVGNPASPNAMVITDKCEHPEVLVAWADYFYSEEGGALVYMGIEGKTYKWLEDGTWEWILSPEYGEDVTSLRAKSTIQGVVGDPCLQSAPWFKMSPTIDADEVYLWVWREKLAEGGFSFPGLSYTEDENSELSIKTTDLNNYINVYIAEVITGQKDLDATWDEYVNQMEKMGSKDIEAIYRAAYERAVK